MQILGWFLVVAGALFILLGLARAAADAFAEFKKSLAPLGIVETIQALGKLLEALAKLPTSIILTLVGIALIVAGQRVLAGLPILPW